MKNTTTFFAFIMSICFIIFINTCINKESNKIDVVMKDTIVCDTTPKDTIVAIMVGNRNHCVSKSSYDSLVLKLKEWEQFSDTIYTGIAGEHLIGYGYLLKNNKFEKRFRKGITEKTADSLLKKELNIAVDYVANNTNLKGEKLIAISSFCYQMGIGRLKKSRLYDNIQAGNDSLVAKELLKWSYYRIGKKYVRSNHIYQRRAWESKKFYKLPEN